MAKPGDYDLTDEEVTELDPDKAAARDAEEVAIGLPDLPGKTRLPEYAMNTPDHPPDDDAPDSMTEAVMRNLRIGAGSDEDEDREGEEGGR